MLTIRGLRKVFRGKALPAVTDLDLDVRPGEIVGLVGLNGAGKTTTIRAAAGLCTPTSGTVTVFGLDLTRQKAEASRHIGWVPEVPNFEPGSRALAQLRYYAGFYDLSGPAARERCSALLQQVGLPGVERIRLRTFSQGMRKRFSLAASLLGDPEILLFDEILSGLDPEGVALVRNLMLELRGQNRGILLSSHILSEVQQVADRVAIVHQGRLVKTLTREEVANAGGLTLRVTVANLDEAGVGILRGFGEVRREANTVWISNPIKESSEINAELVRRNYTVVALGYEPRNLEQLFFDAIRAPEAAGP
ncbi:MAG: ABC transporter ATP-binding protein [Thermoplasmata archaeon]|nr:ABC transporter ATP-binding protein [Thermoplasmata archaeon]